MVECLTDDEAMSARMGTDKHSHRNAPAFALLNYKFRSVGNAIPKGQHQIRVLDDGDVPFQRSGAPVFLGSTVSFQGVERAKKFFARRPKSADNPLWIGEHF